MRVQKEKFEADIVAKLPMLKRCALSLTGNHSQADDLVQDCVVRSLTRAEQFLAGTNLEAWLLTIMRSIFYNDKRHEKIVRDHAKLAQKTMPLTQPPAQLHQLEFKEVSRAFRQLSRNHRTVLQLVGAEQRSHKEAAQIIGVPVATTKTRLFRARERLKVLMAA